MELVVDEMFSDGPVTFENWVKGILNNDNKSTQFLDKTKIAAN